MKNYILIAVIVLIALNTQAQKFDKDLLYGKWIWRGMKAGAIIIHKDSVNESVASFLKLSCTDRKGYTCTKADTIDITKRLTTQLKGLKANFMIFSGSNGTGQVQDTDHKAKRPPASFKWVSDNELKVEGLSQKFTIAKLTKKELVLIMFASEGASTTLYTHRKGRS